MTNARERFTAHEAGERGATDADPGRLRGCDETVLRDGRSVKRLERLCRTHELTSLRLLHYTVAKAAE